MVGIDLEPISREIGRTAQTSGDVEEPAGQRSLIHVCAKVFQPCQACRMGNILKRLHAGSDCYDLEETGYGIVLIRRIDHDDEFTGFVRHLLNWAGDEFVVLPVTDGHHGYEQVILLPFKPGMTF